MVSKVAIIHGLLYSFLRLYLLLQKKRNSKMVPFNPGGQHGTKKDI
jgi:hypothetical protein